LKEYVLAAWYVCWGTTAAQAAGEQIEHRMAVE
jgi:hypothetical protein